MPEEQLPYTEINVEEAKRLLDEGGAVVVDVRELHEYVAGHVKDALFIPINSLMERIQELPRDKKLLFICASGVRSALACETAAAMGFPPQQLYNVVDGTPAWIEKGYPASYGNDP